MACPVCGSDLEGRFEEWDGEQAMTGTLVCEPCVRSFPILRGVPRMNRGMEGMERVAETFGYEWKTHHAGELEDDTLFGRTLEEDWRYFLDALACLIARSRARWFSMGGVVLVGRRARWATMVRRR